MEDSTRGNPIQVAVVVLLLVGGGWYFFKNYNIQGLDGVRVSPKNELWGDAELTSFPGESEFSGDSSRLVSGIAASSAQATSENPFTSTGRAAVTATPASVSPRPPARIANLRIASWALDGFGPTKLANPIARQNIVRIVHQFDIVALQQIAAIERDLIPRLVDEINQSGRRYDFVLGESNGPAGRQEQLAFVFDTTRVRVDRNQTYTVADPMNQMGYDPLVAWFQAAQPSVETAWTFSLVNIRVDLGQAPVEVALLPGILKSVRNDGRNEDDVVLTGLFQADDAYLVPTLVGDNIVAAVRSVPTDVFGRYQTSNILMDTTFCSEYLGRGGALDFLRVYNMSLADAEVVTSHLPVYAEFTATEGGRL
ncbi:deoxyribonuclease I [Novipirellula caenicola]|uniref:Endonuclease/Exonuclease/phosphatase family protein n=1 Tax=Novipirellula caenicola TaxID=1536901 RepID=A0ABP9VVS3_9BACT